MLDLLATGYPSLDHIVPISHIPAVGQTALLGEALDRVPATYGGCGANVAVGLAKLGFSTGVALVLGADSDGDAYRRHLLDCGVNCQNIRQIASAATSTSYLCRAPDGEIINFFHPGAADAWHGNLILADLDAVRWGLVTVGYAPYNRAFVECLLDAHIPLIWQMKADIAAYPPAVIMQFLAASRIVFCNRIEAKYVCAAVGADDLRGLFGHGTDLIVLTLGGEGSLVLTPETEYRVPAVAAQVVDTTGAGDAYTTGFLAGLWRGFPPQACGLLGAVAAAFTIEAVGCQTNLPDWDALLARYQENTGAL